MLQLGATCKPLTWRATVIPCNLTALKQTYRITSSQTASHNVIPDHIAEDHTSNKMALLLRVMIIPILIKVLIETFGTVQFSSKTVTNNLQSPSIVIWVCHWYLFDRVHMCLSRLPARLGENAAMSLLQLFCGTVLLNLFSCPNAKHKDIILAFRSAREVLYVPYV